MVRAIRPAIDQKLGRSNTCLRLSEKGEGKKGKEEKKRRIWSSGSRDCQVRQARHAAPLRKRRPRRSASATVLTVIKGAVRVDSDCYPEGFQRGQARHDQRLIRRKDAKKKTKAKKEESG